MCIANKKPETDSTLYVTTKKETETKLHNYTSLIIIIYDSSGIRTIVDLEILDK